jgi:hypothetical protein
MAHEVRGALIAWAKSFFNPDWFTFRCLACTNPQLFLPKPAVFDISPASPFFILPDKLACPPTLRVGSLASKVTFYPEAM